MLVRKLLELGLDHNFFNPFGKLFRELVENFENNIFISGKSCKNQIKA
jgi:hypothetical protein